jgi:hypothetical protein
MRTGRPVTGRQSRPLARSSAGLTVPSWNPNYFYAGTGGGGSTPIVPDWVLRSASTARPALIDIRLNTTPGDACWYNGNLVPISSVLQEVRAGTVTQTDLAGNVLSVAANTLRMCDAGLLPFESRTNFIRNNTMVGVTPGVVGSGGVLPTNWSAIVVSGLTTTVIGSGVDANGISYCDVRISGTTNSTNYFLGFETSTGIDALTAQTWTGSAYLSLVGGALTNVTNVRINLSERTSVGGFVAEGAGNTTSVTVNATMQRMNHTRTLSGGGTTAKLQPSVRFDIANGVAVDFTIRLGFPQCEQAAFASPVIPTSTVAVTAAASNVSFIDTTGQRLDRGTWVVEWSDVLGPISANHNMLTLRVDGSNYLQMQITSGNKVTPQIAVAASNQIGMPSANNVVAGSNYKFAFAYELNNSVARYTASLGADPADDTGCTMITGAFTSQVGAFSSNNTCFNQPITRLTYFDERLPNTDLAAFVA